MAAKKTKACDDVHVLVFPFPSQGHINPMLQFSKVLASKGLKVTLATTHYVTKKTFIQETELGLINVQSYSDGFDEGGFAQAGSIQAYLEVFETVGYKNLQEIIEKQNSTTRYHFKCLIYDAIIPWGFTLAKKLGLMRAQFFTQSCAVNSIYYNMKQGLLCNPVQGPSVSLPGLPLLEVHDLPSYVYDSVLYPSALTSHINQFSDICEVDWLLINSFAELEDEVVNRMAEQCPSRYITIGPTVPYIYRDNQVEGDNNGYGISLFKPVSDVYANWLNTKEPASVVYVSFGSVATLGSDQMEEIAWGLKNSDKYFLWVVKDSEENMLPNIFGEKTSNKGLVATWCRQMEVLEHPAVGCFLTHCGWNSTLEAMSLGVPMVAMPQWTDQPTNAKFVEDVWEIGVRAKKDETGIVKREAIEVCIREVMEDGSRRAEFQSNAAKWRKLAKQAVDEGGSSDRNIDDFVASLQLQ